MNALARLGHALKRAWFGPIGSSNPAILDFFGIKPVSSGVSVTEETALTYTAVWACVNLIAGTIGSLPLVLYRKTKDGGKEPMVENKLFAILHDQPNPEMSSAAFRETLHAHILLWGNGFAEIVRNGAGKVVELWPIEPWRVLAYRDYTQGPAYSLRYRVTNFGGQDSFLRPDQILHVPGLSPDGVWGYSVIRKARESIGLGLATEKFGATFFGQGSTFGGVLTHPARLSEAARENLRKSINDRHQGVDRAHNFIILEEGIKYDRLGIPPEDAQFLETRKFQRNEIASLFGVPPHLVGDVERTTSWGTGVEQQTIGFVTYNLRRWLVKWEQELERKLIPPLEWQQQSIAFNLNALLRGDMATRYQAYQIGRSWGWLNANKILGLEDMDPIGPQGDIYLVPANMIPADKIPDPTQAAPGGPSFGAGGDPAAAGNEPTVEPPRKPTRGDLDDVLIRVLERQSQNGHEEKLWAELANLREAIPEPAPPADLTPILDELRVAKEARQTYQERLGAVLPGLLALIEGETRAFVRREGDRLRRAASSPEKLAAWIGKFYTLQADYAVRALGPSMRLHYALIGREADTETEIRALVERYARESQDALAALLAAPPENLAEAVETLAARWETDRPSALAAALLQEVVTDASP